MCKYCECKTNPHFPSLGCNGAEIVDSKYIGCEIQFDSGFCGYRIHVTGEDEGYSEVISFCPFCGRKLN